MDSLQSPRRSGRFRIAAGLIVVAIIGLVITVDVLRKQRGEPSLSGQTGQLTEQERRNHEKAQEVVAAVRKIYIIPADVIPTVAAVVDAEQLKKQNSFYNRAENGHYVIITNDRALLYDPVKNVIVDVMQIEPTVSSAKSSTSSAKVK
jgi:hypothetical protein